VTGSVDSAVLDVVLTDDVASSVVRSAVVGYVVVF